MAMLLHIDTAVESASVCISKDAEALQLAVNNNQKDHAAWIHPAIQNILKDARLTGKDIDAIAVSIGPGSYTGLRIGLSAAKGLCFALGIPLITIGTLELMAYAVKETDADLICPLIDARRMEVFTAVYDKSMTEIQKPCAMVITKSSFSELLTSYKIIFCGNGRKKLQTLLPDGRNVTFSDEQATASHMCYPAYQSFMEKKFSDVTYTEPLYIKEFFSFLP